MFKIDIRLVVCLKHASVTNMHWKLFEFYFNIDLNCFFVSFALYWYLFFYSELEQQ